MLDMRPPADLDIGPCPGLPIRYVPRERAPLPLTRRPLRTTGQPIQRPTPDGAVWRNGTRVRSTHRPWDPTDPEQRHERAPDQCRSLLSPAHLPRGGTVDR